ncbi:WhiB family transcriptional regulator [Mycolicibacterium fortuitum]
MTNDWRHKAACRDMDSAPFFPEPGENAPHAKAICETCPAQTQCLQFALDNEEPHGIWGGLSPEERHRVKRGLPIRRKPTPTDQQCQQCGEQFQPKHRLAIYCTDTCRKTAQAQRMEDRRSAEPRDCAHCKTSFTGKGGAKYCSRECKRAGMTAKIRSSDVRYQATCGMCSTGFTADQPTIKYCSHECKQGAARIQARAYKLRQKKAGNRV